MAKITHITVYEPEQHVVIFRGKQGRRYPNSSKYSVDRLSELLYKMYLRGKVVHRAFMGIHEYDIKDIAKYAIYMEGINRVIIGTKDQIKGYLKETLGNSLMFIDWHEDCVTTGMEPDNVKCDIPIVTIERLK